MWEPARPRQGKLGLREASHGTLHIAAGKSWKSVKWPLSAGALTCILVPATDPRRIHRNVEQPCRRRNRDRAGHALEINNSCC